MTNSFVTNAVLIERTVSCCHPHQLISQNTQYLDSWLSDLLHNELKMKLLEVEGGRAAVPHSWLRHWLPGTAVDGVTLIFLKKLTKSDDFFSYRE